MAVRRNEVVGFEGVMRNLDEELRKIKGNCRAGIVEAGTKLEAAAQRRAPHEHGGLVGSAYSDWSMDDPDVYEIGFTAAYAPFVHEATDEKLRGKRRPSGLGTYWNPGESKFLEGAVEDNAFAILEIVRRRARVDRP